MPFGRDVDAPTAKRSRTFGCDYLAKLYPHAADEEDMEFEEATHTYTYRGVRVEKSCTTLVNENFEEFDASSTVDAFYERWKASEDARYWGIIGCTCATSDDERISDDEAKRRIVAQWEASGAEASRKGTLLHMYCERIFNVAPGDPPIPPDAFADVAQEVNQHADFMRSEFIARHALTPYATELLVWYTIDQVVVSAGQVDAVMRSGNSGEYFLIDWKRVKKKYELTDAELPFADRHGFGECSAIPDTRFHRYYLQCSIDAIMLAHSHGLDVGARLYLVRMHEDRDNYQVMHCCDWRPVAQVLLQMEHKRLMEEPERCLSA